VRYDRRVPPQVFGRYVLEELLASGGMGEVYLATDLGSAGAQAAYRRPCVIKRILPHLCEQPDMVAMFAREAALGALLSHHAITQLLDHGVIGGRHYTAFEYVKGCNLKSLLDAHRISLSPVPLGNVTHILTHVAMALDHAHRARAPDGSALQLVHRDVSPQNVLLSVDGEVKLTDFGMARGTAMRGVYQTQETMLKGKLAYLSPEQASGVQVDARSDVFALGVVLYELLTLQHPFTHDGISGVALLDRIRKVAFPPPRDLRPDAPGWMLDLLQRCLVAEPNDRIPSAVAVLDLVTEGAPIHHAQASLSAHLRRMGLPQTSDAAARTRESVKPVVSASPVPKTQEAPKPLQPKATEEVWHNTPPRPSEEDSVMLVAPTHGAVRWVAGALLLAAAAGAAIMASSSSEEPVARPIATAEDAGPAVKAVPVRAPEKRKLPPRGQGSRLKHVVDTGALVDALPDIPDAAVPVSADGG